MFPTLCAVVDIAICTWNVSQTYVAKSCLRAAFLTYCTDTRPADAKLPVTGLKHISVGLISVKVMGMMIFSMVVSNFKFVTAFMQLVQWIMLVKYKTPTQS
jgi:hypothetical protein